MNSNLHDLIRYLAEAEKWLKKVDETVGKLVKEELEKDAPDSELRIPDGHKQE